MPALAIIDLGAVALAFQAAYWTRFSSEVFLSYFPAVKGIPDIALYHSVLWAVLPLWLMVFAFSGFYRKRGLGIYDEFILVAKGVALASLAVMAISFAYRASEYSRLVVGLWGFYALVLVFLLRESMKAIFGKLLQKFVGPRHILVVGGGETAESIEKAARRDPSIHVHRLPSVPAEAELRQALLHHNIAEVILLQGSLSKPQILLAARLCEDLGADCQVIPDLFEIRRGQIIMNGFLGLPTFHIKSLSLHGSTFVLKRAFDVGVSLIILSALFVPLAMITLLIKLESRGPVLYSHDRVGLRGRHFNCFKFRTMVVNADEMLGKIRHMSDRPGPVFKMKKDPRITRIGKWLRALSIDEVPQLINVLRGDMSLVGPRPQVLWEAEAYDDYARIRLRVLPGITGLWQVSGRAALSYEEMIDLDVFYVENWSPGLDLKILLKTLPAVLAKEGAY